MDEELRRQLIRMNDEGEDLTEIIQFLVELQKLPCLPESTDSERNGPMGWSSEV